MHIQAIPRQKHRNQAYSSSCVQVRCRLIEIEEEMSRLQAAWTVDLVTSSSGSRSMRGRRRLLTALPRHSQQQQLAHEECIFIHSYFLW
jgi:hypothetical protein